MWMINYNQNNNNDIIIIFGPPILPICMLVQLYRSFFVYPLPRGLNSSHQFGKAHNEFKKIQLYMSTCT